MGGDYTAAVMMNGIQSFLAEFAPPLLGNRPPVPSAEEVLASDEIKARLDAMGTVPGGGSPEDFNRFIDAETAKWAKVIKAAGVTADG